jgi:hypothetical protein
VSFNHSKSYSGNNILQVDLIYEVLRQGEEIT